MTYALSGLLAVLAFAAVGGAVFFAAVLGARTHDAHIRGMRRIHNDRRTNP